MDEQTARLIRREIRYRQAPGWAAIWIILGTVITFGAVAVLGWVDHFLRQHQWIQ